MSIVSKPVWSIHIELLLISKHYLFPFFHIPTNLLHAPFQPLFFMFSVIDGAVTIGTHYNAALFCRISFTLDKHRGKQRDNRNSLALILPL